VVFWLLECGAPWVVVLVHLISLCSLTQLSGNGAAPDDAGTVRPTATAAVARAAPKVFLRIDLIPPLNLLDSPLYLCKRSAAGSGSCEVRKKSRYLRAFPGCGSNARSVQRLVRASVQRDTAGAMSEENVEIVRRASAYEHYGDGDRAEAAEWLVRQPFRQFPRIPPTD
jgi:hypothetical protein